MSQAVFNLKSVYFLSASFSNSGYSKPFFVVYWYAYVHNDPVNLRDLWGLTASDSGSINFPIRSGDVLSQITKDHNYRYGTDYTAEEIAAMNGIANPDLIYAGNSLKLPVPASSLYASSVSENKKESTAMVPAVQEQKGGPVITVGVSANFVFGVGADVSFGLQFDLGNPDNSGIVVGGGFGAGASIGAGGFISISPVSSEDNLVSGSTGIMLSPVSVGVGLSNNGDLTVTGGIGTGFGFYNSIEHSSFTSFSDFSESFIDSLSTLKLPY